MHYTDNRLKLGATHSISAYALHDIRDEHREKMFRHITYSLSRALREEADKAAQTAKWDHYLFVEVLPYEWPDMSERALEAVRYTPMATLEVRAQGHIFERLPDWDVRVMENTPHATYAIGQPRPVATLSGERGYAVQGNETIFFWPAEK